QVIPKFTDDAMRNIHMPTYNQHDYYNDLMEVTKNKSDPNLTHHLAAKSFETIMWLKEQGVEFELNENQYFEEGENLRFWGGLPVKTAGKGIGLINTLLKRADAVGIDIYYKTQGYKLEKKNNK